MKKGQMFIVTMVFLTGLIFATQQILIQYSFLDLSEPFQRSDSHVMGSVRDMFHVAIGNSPDCSCATLAVTELHHWLIRQDMGGYALDITYNSRSQPNLDCDLWGNGQVLNLSIHIVGPGTDSKMLYYYTDQGLVDVPSYPDIYPPTITNVEIYPDSGPPKTIFTISADIYDPSGVDEETVEAYIMDGEISVDTTPLYRVSGTYYENTWDSTGFCPGDCYFTVEVCACDLLGKCAEACGGFV